MREEVEEDRLLSLLGLSTDSESGLRGLGC